MFHEIKVKSVLNKIPDRFPYKWDLNIYRGCQHNCKYCYALYSHDYLQTNNFFGNIFVKTNILELLEKKLKSKKWQRELINLGGVTDSYQYNAESKYKLMPEILKLFIKYKQPITISTKSDLILRDIELWDKLAHITYTNIGVSLITTNEKLKPIIEPGASEIKARLKIFENFSNTKVSLGRHCMPILPMITDNEKNLEELIYFASKYKVNYFLAGFLNLSGKTRLSYLSMIEKNFPDLKEKYTKLYKNKFIDKKYSANIMQYIYRLKMKYNIGKGYVPCYKQEEKKIEHIQIPLF